jgi:hypothetical protein
MKARHVQVKWSERSAAVQDKYFLDDREVSYKEYCQGRKEAIASGELVDQRETEIDPTAVDTRSWF